MPKTSTRILPWWPGDEERALIRSWLAEFGGAAYGGAYLLGAYQHQGLSLQAAAKRVRRELKRHCPPHPQ